MTRIRGLYREAGFGAVMLFGIKKLVNPVMDFGTLLFFECDLTQTRCEVPVDNAFIAREAFMCDLALLDALEDRDRHKRAAAERLQRGERWFVGIDSKSGQLANFRWLNHQSGFIPEIGRYLGLKAGEVYIYDLYTLPPYRRLGVDAAVRPAVYKHLQESGIQRIHAYVRGSNYASLKAARRLLRSIGRVFYVTAFGRSWVLAFGNDTMPALYKDVDEGRLLRHLAGGSG